MVYGSVPLKFGEGLPKVQDWGERRLLEAEQADSYNAYWDIWLG